MDGPRSPIEPDPGAIGRPEDLLGRVGGGDAAAPPEEGPEPWRRCSELAAVAERAWVDLAAGDNPAAAASLTHGMAELRGELAGPDPSPLERLAVDRVVLTWLQSWYADVAVAAAVDIPPRVAEFALQGQDRAQKRHLAALAGLATIRRLLPGRVGPTSTDEPLGRRPSPGEAFARPLSIVRPDDPGVDDGTGRRDGPDGPGATRSGDRDGQNDRDDASK